MFLCGFVVVVIVVDVAVVVFLGIIVVIVVVFLFVVVVVVVKVAVVVVVVVFASDGVSAVVVVGIFVQVDIISFTPGVIIALEDADDRIVGGKLHHRNDFCHAYVQFLGLCTENMAFVIVLETILISMVSSTLSISKLTSPIIVPMTVWHGLPYGCGHSVGVCLI